MNFLLKQTSSVHQQQSPCLVVGVYQKGKLSSTAKDLDKATKKSISNLLKLGDFSGELAETTLLYNLNGCKAERVCLVGFGDMKKVTLSAYQKAVSAAFTALKKAKVKEAHSYLDEVELIDGSESQKLQQAVLALHHVQYEYNDYKSTKKTVINTKLHWLVKKVSAAQKKTVQQALSCTVGMTTTKNLANCPPNVAHPTYMADFAKKLAGKYSKLTVKSFGTADLKKMKMGAYLAVAQGSIQPPKLVVMNYNGGKKGEKPIALVGKGITFDTGGVSLKPGAAMMGMKFDMCGAATVAGTMHAIAEMKLPINVVGLLVCAENMPSDRSSRPDDVVTSMSGQTIEISNTDAEGRLVLCDALTYVQKHHNPSKVIDMATLTGACVVALGHHASAVYANEQSLADDLVAAGDATLDRAWQMPLWEEYDEQLKSVVADVNNIGGMPAGSITAACFLARFTKEVNWAHLDIAGTASKMGKDGLATGRPVPLLVQYLIEQAS